jgi:glycosyltransferase involved in cell wall biosynthesis
MQPNPWVRVVIVNFNSGPVLQQVIDGLARQSDGGFEAILIDNGSTEGWIGDLCLPDRRFRVIRASANLATPRRPGWRC